MTGMSPNPRRERCSYTAGMDTVRPLRSVLDDLVGAGEGPGEAEQALRVAGHQDLAPELLAEAVVSYAALAPPALAEHLAPFVTAQSPAAVATGPGSVDAGPGWGLDLIATARRDDDLDDLGAVTDPQDLDGLDVLDETAGPLSGAEQPSAPDDVDVEELDFGAAPSPGSADEWASEANPPSDATVDGPFDSPLGVPFDVSIDIPVDTEPPAEEPLGGPVLDVDPDRVLDADAASTEAPDEESPGELPPSW